MITLLTGLPGNGKTLFLLWFIKDKAKRENREVFYSGINIVDKVSLPWTEFKAEEWMTLPKGAIILIDEAQFTFEKKPNGAKLPNYYSDLAIHRHSGYDIFLATQHPTLLDNFVRQLVGQHFHAVRKFGFERSTIYEWSAANAAPQLASSQKSAVSLKWAFRKEVYQWYKSAEVHTVKKRVPAKLVLAVLLVIAIVGGVGYKFSHPVVRKPVVEGVQAAPAVATSAGAGVVSGVAAKDKPFDPIADAKNYVAMNTPRVQGLPHTAPKYDEITKPVRAPIPAMCIQIGSVHDRGSKVSCKCWSQQATPMDVSFNMCIEFARNGFFRDFDADRDRLALERTERGVEALKSVPEASVPVREDQRRPEVTILPGKPMGPQRTDTSPGLNEAGEIEDGPPNNRATRAAAGAKAAG